MGLSPKLGLYRVYIGIYGAFPKIRVIFGLYRDLGFRDLGFGVLSPKLGLYMVYIGIWGLGMWVLGFI